LKKERIGINISQKSISSSKKYAKKLENKYRARGKKEKQAFAGYTHQK
jgi:hypothetical protein